MLVTLSPTCALKCPPATKSLPSGNAAAPLQKILSVTVMEEKLVVGGSQSTTSWPADCASDVSTRPVGSKAICTATIGQSKGPDHCPTWLVGGGPSGGGDPSGGGLGVFVTGGLLVSLAELPPLPHPVGNDVKAPISRRMRIRPVDLNEYVTTIEK
jgi:hypothetical protein